jgi:hypothetical protein
MSSADCYRAADEAVTRRISEVSGSNVTPDTTD